MAIVAIAARLLVVREAAARTAVLVRVAVGLGVIGFAALLTLVSASYGAFSAGGSKWFLICSVSNLIFAAIRGLNSRRKPEASAHPSAAKPES